MELPSRERTTARIFYSRRRTVAVYTSHAAVRPRGYRGERRRATAAATLYAALRALPGLAGAR